MEKVKEIKHLKKIIMIIQKFCVRHDKHVSYFLYTHTEYCVNFFRFLSYV